MHDVPCPLSAYEMYFQFLLIQDVPHRILLGDLSTQSQKRLQKLDLPMTEFIVKVTRVTGLKIKYRKRGIFWENVNRVILKMWKD